MGRGSTPYDFMNIYGPLWSALKNKRELLILLCPQVHPNSVLMVMEAMRNDVQTGNAMVTMDLMDFLRPGWSNIFRGPASYTRNSSNPRGLSDTKLENYKQWGPHAICLAPCYYDRYHTKG